MEKDPLSWQIPGRASPTLEAMGVALERGPVELGFDLFEQPKNFVATSAAPPGAPLVAPRDSPWAQWAGGEPHNRASEARIDTAVPGCREKPHAPAASLGDVAHDPQGHLLAQPAVYPGFDFSESHWLQAIYGRLRENGEPVRTRSTSDGCPLPLASA